FFFQAEDGIRDRNVTGVQTCALPILVKCERDLCRPDAGNVKLHNHPSSKEMARGLRAIESLFDFPAVQDQEVQRIELALAGSDKIGRASCRERVWRSGGGGV